MVTVGIIANPASGKDIRRLVAHGSVFDNDEKVSIVRRVLLGLEAVGVERAWIMPDRFGIGLKALDGLKLAIEASLLEMPAFFNQDDSCRAAGLLAERGVRCIVTLGGDGTNRAVAHACGHVPLMPISTGTNNVFPLMIEATTAGLAAGLVACGKADAAVAHAPRIDIFLSLPHPPNLSPLVGKMEQASPAGLSQREQESGGAGQPDDIALIDAAIYDERFVAARAIWDGAKIKEVVLTRAEPGNIGLSSIGAHMLAGSHLPGHGVYLRLDGGGQAVRAPIAPGLFQMVYVAEHRLLAPGDEVVIRHERPCVLALDGEREVESLLELLVALSEVHEVHLKVDTTTDHEVHLKVDTTTDPEVHLKVDTTTEHGNSDRSVRLQPDLVFRLSSLEPMDCTPEIVDLVASSPCFAPHFHLPLQHASDRILTAMRRPYTAASYASLVDGIRSRIPAASIGSDVIVGFPGETEEDFETLARYLERSPLTHLHVFPYSDRPGTAAAALPNKVHGAAIRERARRVREIGARLTARFRESQIGTMHRALTIEDGTLAVTGNYLKLRIPSGRVRNEWIRVKVASAGSEMTAQEL